MNMTSVVFNKEENIYSKKAKYLQKNKTIDEINFIEWTKTKATPKKKSKKLDPYNTLFVDQVTVFEQVDQVTVFEQVDQVTVFEQVIAPPNPYPCP
jgi:hypothetical protein